MPGPAVDADGVRLEPMTSDELDRWSPHSTRGAAAQLVAAGLLPAPEATARAEQQLTGLLSAGVDTPLHHLWTVRSTDAERTLLGHLWMRVRPSPHEVEAYVLDVELLAGSRGRGLGRATMLAAEQAARELGATVARLNVFEHNTAAVRLYGRLGYAAVGSTLVSRLDGEVVAETPEDPDVELRPMTDVEYARLRARLEADREAEHRRVGASPGQARRAAADDLRRALPGGAASPGHRLWTARASTATDDEDDGTVASVWLQLSERSDGRHAFVHWVEVPRHRRRRGHGRAVARAVELACRRMGVGSLTLTVPGSGPAWLLDGCGFRVAARTLAREL